MDAVVTFSKIIPATETTFFVRQDQADLLLHMDGADTSTVFPDATGRHTLTPVGTAQIDTAQFKFGGASMLNLVEGDHVTVSNNLSDFGFGTGDFTVDCWVRPTVLGDQSHVIIDLGGGNVENAPNGLLRASIDGTVSFYFANSGLRITGSPFVVGVWQHLALTRASGTTRMFLNGTQTGSDYIDSNNYVTPTYVDIGAADGSFSWFGWIDEVRTLKGTAVWTTTFQPPTGPYYLGG